MNFSIVIATIWSIGFVVMILWMLLAERKRKKESLLQANAEEPWLGNRQWAEGKIRTSSRNFNLFMFSLGIWSLFCVALVAPYLEKPDELLVKIVAYVLWGGGIFFVAGFLYMLLRRFKYGQSVLEMASVPGVIGGQFAGVIRTSTKIRNEDVFRLRLTCIHGKMQNSGDSQCIKRNMIWEGEQLIAHDLLRNEGSQSAIPFLFQIPYECRQTDLRDTENFIEWKLEVTAKTPGVDYRSEFEVPIFKTAQSDPDFVVDQSLIEKYTAPEDPKRDLRDARVRRTISPSGDTRFIFPMARQVGIAILTTLVTVMCLGVPVLFFYLDVEVVVMIPFTAVFGFFGIFFLFVTLDIWFYRSVVDVSPRGLGVKAGLFGGRIRRWIAFSEIKEIKLDCHLKSEKQKYYDIVAVCSDEKKITIAKRLPGQRLANSVQKQIEEVLLGEA